MKSACVRVCVCIVCECVCVSVFCFDRICMTNSNTHTYTGTQHAERVRGVREPPRVCFTNLTESCSRWSRRSGGGGARRERKWGAKGRGVHSAWHRSVRYLRHDFFINDGLHMKHRVWPCFSPVTLGSFFFRLFFSLLQPSPAWNSERCHHRVHTGCTESVHFKSLRTYEVIQN
jgi:hypothetical protein